MGLIRGLVMALSGKTHEQQHYTGYTTRPVHYVPTHSTNNGFYIQPQPQPQRSSCHQRKFERRIERECRRTERKMLRAEHRCERAVRRAERRGGCSSRRQPVVVVPVPMGQRGGHVPQEMQAGFVREDRQPEMYASAVESAGVEEMKPSSRSVSAVTLREDAPPSYEELERKN